MPDSDVYWQMIEFYGLKALVGENDISCSVDSRLR